MSEKEKKKEKKKGKKKRKKRKEKKRKNNHRKLLHCGVGEDAAPFPGLLHFTLDPYLIMHSVKHFLRFWYDSTWE